MMFIQDAGRLLIDTSIIMHFNSMKMTLLTFSLSMALARPAREPPPNGYTGKPVLPADAKLPNLIHIKNSAPTPLPRTAMLKTNDKQWMPMLPFNAGNLPDHYPAPLLDNIVVWDPDPHKRPVGSTIIRDDNGNWNYNHYRFDVPNHHMQQSAFQRANAPDMLNRRRETLDALKRKK